MVGEIMKTLIAIPCMDMVHSVFTACLVGLRLTGETEFRFSQNSLVYDSRNKLAEYAVRNKFDRVLWLDSDMTFPSDLLILLGKDLEDYDMVSAVYTTRKTPIVPVIYQKIDPVGRLGPEAVPFKVIPDGIFEIAGCGFGAVMMKTSVLAAVMKTYGYMFSPIIGMGEDLSFCHRVNQLKIKMYCDGSIKCGHVGMTEYKASDLPLIEVEK